MTVRRLPSSVGLDEVINKVSSPEVGAVITCSFGEERIVVATGHREEAWSLLRQASSQRTEAVDGSIRNGAAPETGSRNPPIIALVEGPVPHWYVAETQACTVTFTGLVRNDRLASGQVVSALVYESYAAMALRYMRRLAAEHHLGIFIHTGSGAVPVGSISVHVAGPTVHDVQTAVEALKRSVPIWKQDLATLSIATPLKQPPSSP
ncbi:hypothetical protein CCYA_CCYA04G1162 [Cyanidiococcus yangmingshanensis]|nr:hypothetical protein CCYA_CCYA04G1162 [Cyanidiococcus yangmingshanensis]